MDSNSENKIDKIENNTFNTKEEIFEPKEEVLTPTEIEEETNKITQTLDVLVEEIETRKKKTFVERIFSFMLRPCSS